MGKSKLSKQLDKVKSKLTPNVVKKEVKESVEDRSAYNCPTCKGDGLVDDNTRCSQCLGTGKI